jgi:hypothetical protein
MPAGRDLMAECGRGGNLLDYLEQLVRLIQRKTT